MSLRACCASIACALMLAAASVCPAAEPTGHRAGRASLGGAAGASFMLADGDYSQGAASRLWFNAQFRYNATSHWRLQVAPGFGWVGYTDEPAPWRDLNFPLDSTKSNYLTLMLPGTAQLQYVMARGPWLSHAGVGGGLYRVWIENRRKVLKDASSKRLHLGIYPGLSGELGVAYFIKGHPDISLEASVGADWIFAQRDEQFKLGFNSFLAPAHLRFGANYYFDIGRNALKPAATPGAPAH